MLLNNEYEVNIEKMVNEGKGLARINQIPVFVKNACPDDVLKVKIVKICKSYAVGEITEILKPSPHRVRPVCALNNVCGSCNWLHIDYEMQLKQKQNIVYETLKKITGQDFKVNQVIPSPKTVQYRCKVQYPVSQKKSGRIIAGYYKENSHELVNIKYCPMQNPLINDILEFIKITAEKTGINGYDEKNNTGCLRHIIFRHDVNISNIIVIFVINSDKITAEIKELAAILEKNFKEIKGICVNFNTKKTNVILGKRTEQLSGNTYYIETLKGIKYRISAGSFFQVNPDCAVNIFDYVKKLIEKNIKNPTILDAYSGVSSFGVWLSSVASKIVCIEEVESASSDAIFNADINSCKNINIINGDAAEKFKELIDNNVKFDVSIIDPPRKGCSEEAINFLTALTSKYIIYVSCNVSTLARDVKILSENKFKPVIIQPVDMFPNTYHVETIVLLEKQQ